MESILAFILGIGDNIGIYVTAALSLLTGLTAIFLLIPGKQPEKTFNAIAAFLEKFSKK